MRRILSKTSGTIHNKVPFRPGSWRRLSSAQINFLLKDFPYLKEKYPDGKIDFNDMSLFNNFAPFFWPKHGSYKTALLLDKLKNAGYPYSKLKREHPQMVIRAERVGQQMFKLLCERDDRRQLAEILEANPLLDQNKVKKLAEGIPKHIMEISNPVIRKETIQWHEGEKFKLRKLLDYGRKRKEQLRRKMQRVHGRKISDVEVAKQLVDVLKEEGNKIQKRSIGMLGPLQIACVPIWIILRKKGLSKSTLID